MDECRHLRTVQQTQIFTCENMGKDSIILGIETSCDEASAAIVKDGRELLANVVSSQIKSHEQFGGVVPEIASRQHTEQITYVLEKTFAEANCTWDDIDA